MKWAVEVGVVSPDIGTASAGVSECPNLDSPKKRVVEETLVASILLRLWWKVQISLHIKRT